MTAKEFKDMFDFAIEAINKKTEKTVDINVQVIVNTKLGAITGDVKEIGFDDKTATIYIEA